MDELSPLYVVIIEGGKQVVLVYFADFVVAQILVDSEEAKVIGGSVENLLGKCEFLGEDNPG